MNAYELADKLMSSLTMEYDCDKYMEQAAAMLRHQADYIKHLEEGLESSIALNKAQVERQNVACNFTKNSCTFPCKKQGLRETKG